MKKVKSLLIISIIFIFLILSLCSNCYAASVPVTEENLKQAFEDMEKFSEDEIKFSINNNVVSLTNGDETGSFKYDLNGNPTFYEEIEIKQGMTYEEYEKQNENVIMPIFGYIAVAYIQGVEFEDATSYIMMSVLENAFGIVSSLDDAYIIIDDINNNYTGEKSEDSKVIYASEFGDRVMEVMNYTYKKPQVITDSNTYNFTTLQKDVTDTSCKLVTTLTVNLGGNFEKIKGAKTNLDSKFENLFENTLEANKNLEEMRREEELLAQGNVSINSGGNSTSKDTEETIPKPEREIEKEILAKMEKEYRAERNKIPNAGDITIKVLRTIIITLVIALIIVIAYSKKRKV